MVMHKPMHQSCPHPATCELFDVSRGTLYSYRPASEVFLQRIKILYVAGHYQMTSNSCQMPQRVTPSFSSRYWRMKSPQTISSITDRAQGKYWWERKLFDGVQIQNTPSAKLVLQWEYLKSSTLTLSQSTNLLSDNRTVCSANAPPLQRLMGRNPENMDYRFYISDGRLVSQNSCMFTGEPAPR